MTENADQEPRETPPIGAVWNGVSWDPPAEPVEPPVAAVDPDSDGRGIGGEPTPLVLPPPGEPPMQASWRTRQRVLTLVGAFVAVGLLLVVASSMSRSSQADREAAEPAASSASADPVPLAADSWLPTGYEMSNDPNLGVRTNSSVNCGDLWTSCIGVDVIAQYGCPNGVFVEAAQLDSTGSLINASNAIGPALSPGARSTIVVGWLDASPSGNVRITRLNCM